MVNYPFSPQNRYNVIGYNTKHSKNGSVSTPFFITSSETLSPEIQRFVSDEIWEIDNKGDWITKHFFCDEEKAWVSCAMSEGYARKSSNFSHKICYKCCAKLDMAEMDRERKITLYLSYKVEKPPQQRSIFTSDLKDAHVSNWPGTLKYPCTVSKSRTPKGKSKYEATFKDHRGFLWHGVLYGEDSQLIKCKRVNIA